MTLNNSSRGVNNLIHSLSEQLVQHFTTLMVKKFFLISNLYLLPLNLNPLPLVLSLHALLKSLCVSYRVASSRGWMAAARLLQGLNNPNSSNTDTALCQY